MTDPPRGFTTPLHGWPDSSRIVMHARARPGRRSGLRPRRRRGARTLCPAAVAVRRSAAHRSARGEGRRHGAGTRGALLRSRSPPGERGGRSRRLHARRRSGSLDLSCHPSRDRDVAATGACAGTRSHDCCDDHDGATPTARGSAEDQHPENGEAHPARPREARPRRGRPEQEGSRPVRARPLQPRPVRACPAGTGQEARPLRWPSRSGSGCA